MSRKFIRPLSVCDRDRALVNGCRVGGYQCPDCGMWYCPDTNDHDAEGRCEDCAAERRAQEAEESEVEK